MSKKRRRKSSDEVTVEIKDSETPRTKYWNLRGNKQYNYNRSNPEKRSSDRKLEDEININFNLNENRKITEEQKQTILNTLIQQQKENPRPRKSSLKKLLALILILLLSGLTLIFFVVANHC